MHRAGDASPIGRSLYRRRRRGGQTGETFGRTDHPGATASIKLSRHPSSARRGMCSSKILVMTIRFCVYVALLAIASCNRTPTFTEDIAPIIFKNCAPCHRPGEAGPFPLLTYEDVLKKAGRIAEVTQARYMPPWPADSSYSHFTGERVLKDREIEAIRKWVENGSPEGDHRKVPRQPAFPEGSLTANPTSW